MFIKFVVKLAACLAVACALLSLSSAQQAPSAGSDSSAQTQTQDSGQPANKPATAQTNPQQPADPVKDSQQAGQGKVAGTSNDRLFYTLPNFLTLENAGHLPPMPVKDKFKAVAVGNFDAIEFPWWGVLAAINQANNSDPAYGQGWEAYAKRYGTVMADSSIENFMVGAVFSSMLRQDPRYYQSGKGSFFRRTGYALSRMVVTRSDAGNPQFNFSEIVGAATAGAISTYSYHPKSVGTPSSPHFIGSERTISNALSTWGTQLYLDAITYEIKEFWPDIHRMLSKHSKKNKMPAVSSAP